MKALAVMGVLCCLLLGCAVGGPAASKSAMGNLELNVYGPDDASIGRAEVYVDGQLIGNASGLKPILFLRRGERRIRVEMPGFKPYEKAVAILGEPNQQVLNVYLERQ